MQKLFALSLAVCLGFTGCQVFERSEAWEEAMSVRPGETMSDPNPSQAYAAKLHQALAARGIEHKVVTYQFRYTPRGRDERVVARTAVIYRDDRNPRHPWWLKDDQQARPFWLPNGTVVQQITFYIRRPAEILNEEHYPVLGADGKSTVAGAAARPWYVKITEPLRSIAAPKLARAKAPAEDPAPLVASEAPGNFNASNIWSQPTVLAPVEQGPDAAGSDPEMEKLFRKKNGTPFNPASSLDRRKMAELEQSRLSQQ